MTAPPSRRWAGQYGKALDLNRALVQRADVKIIFLTRRNELRRVVSTEMSWQTNVWGKYTEARLLDPVMNKLNLTDTYQRIPNITEIERRFGSDESGWLFKETLSEPVLDQLQQA